MTEEHEERGGLVITRKIGESFSLGNSTVELIGRKGNSVKLLICAPKDIEIRRIKPEESPRSEYED